MGSGKGRYGSSSCSGKEESFGSTQEQEQVFRNVRDAFVVSGRVGDGRLYSRISEVILNRGEEKREAQGRKTRRNGNQATEKWIKSNVSFLRL